VEVDISENFGGKILTSSLLSPLSMSTDLVNTQDCPCMKSSIQDMMCPKTFRQGAMKSKSSLKFFHLIYPTATVHIYTSNHNSVSPYLYILHLKMGRQVNMQFVLRYEEAT
jgi:hypothetical protein